MAAALDPEGLAKCLLEEEEFGAVAGRLAEACRGRSTLIQWRRADGSATILAHSGYFTNADLHRYETDFAMRDPWAAAAQGSPLLNRPLRMDDHVSERTYANSFFYNEFVRPLGDDTFHCIGLSVRNRWGSGMVAIQRGRSQGAFQDDDLARLGHLAPHLGRLLAVRGTILALRERAMALEALVAALREPAALIGRAGALVFANAAFERLHADGAYLVVRAGRVTATDVRLADRLDAVLAMAQGPSPVSGSIAVPGRTVAIVVMPLGTQSSPPLSLMLLHGTETGDEPVARLAARHGLTPAEAEVAARLCRGKAVKQIAAERDVAIATVRSQVRTLLDKLGCKRQAEAVALIRSAADHMLVGP